MKRLLVSILDRPGGRWLLSKLATRYARHRGIGDVAIFHRQVWVHQTGPRYTPDGYRFRYVLEEMRAWSGEYELNRRNAQDYWFQFYSPKAGDVIFDVGAGRGEDLVAFAEAVGPTGHVYAIEAHPESYAAMSVYCQLNRLTNVTPIHAAILDQSGAARIATTDIWQENTISTSAGAAGAHVPAETLASICRKYSIQDIHYLKMNIEGAETSALRGIEALAHRIHIVCIACHDFRANLGHGEQYRTRAVVEAILTTAGYDLRSRPDHPLDYVRDHVYGIRDPRE